MLFFLPFAGVIGVIWAPNVADILASPLTSLFDGGAEPVERTPVYSAAEVRLHQGRYAEAAAAVRQELLKFPGDIHGRLLLADILANKLHQPIPAEETLRQILSLPHAPAPARRAPCRQPLAPSWEAQASRRPESPAAWCREEFPAGGAAQGWRCESAVAH